MTYEDVFKEQLRKSGYVVTYLEEKDKNDFQRSVTVTISCPTEGEGTGKTLFHFKVYSYESFEDVYKSAHGYIVGNLLDIIKIYL